MAKVEIIGGGLAGCEAAYQLAKSGCQVILYEMRPNKTSPAHHTAHLAELVCSNSFRADQIENAVGLLKEEMRQLDSIIMRAADSSRVPAGGALAVDRYRFTAAVEGILQSFPNICVIREEKTRVDVSVPTIIAAGPLASDALINGLKPYISDKSLSFFDAAAPIVTRDSLNMECLYYASRYNKGTADYLNAPMTEKEYRTFFQELTAAKTVEMKAFEKDAKVFEGCMPIEVMAKRGIDTMRFGPLKPVGLINPQTGQTPYAVVQLRKENLEGSLFNLVGFQTNLTFKEQKRVFGLIPGLADAEFMRYGVMHRNTFIKSPELLDNTYRMREMGNIYFAGQISGVEGYIESASSGMVAGLALTQRLKGKEFVGFPSTTAIGALAHYVSMGSKVDFQPMNVNFGIISPLEVRIKNKRERYQRLAERAITQVKCIAAQLKQV